MERLRFMLVGNYTGKGYAVKDLEDEIVEYLSKEELIDAASKVKIYGVIDGRIDFDWFKDYYVRYVMAFGLESAEDYFGLILTDNGEFIYKTVSGMHSSVGIPVSFKFIEFVERFNLNSVVLSRLYCYYFAKNHTSLFHLNGKFKTLYTLIADYVNGLDIGNILLYGASVTFSKDDNGLVYIYDLRMSNIVYNIGCREGVVLINSPENSTVVLSSMHNIYVHRNCNLTNVWIDPELCGYLTVYLDEGMSSNDVSNLFSRFTARRKFEVGIKFKRCKFDGDKNFIVID